MDPQNKINEGVREDLVFMEFSFLFEVRFKPF